MARIATGTSHSHHGSMPERLTRNVSLPPSQEVFIDTLVRSGRYRTASEVVRDGLRLLEEAERRRQLEEWLCGGRGGAKSHRLSAAGRKRLQEWLGRIVEIARRDVAAGRVADGPAVVKRLAHRLRKRR